jgi:hypothetical protein
VILFRGERNSNDEIYKMSYSIGSNQEDFTSPFEEMSLGQLNKGLQKF